MAHEFKLPALGADMESGTIVEWHVAPGSCVKRGDVVAVVETDKGAIDVEIFEDGVVREIVVEPGRKVSVGTVLALVDPEGEAFAPSPAPTGEGKGEAVTPSPSPAGEGEGHAPVTAAVQRRKISPAARRRARELGVDAAALEGTGPDGAVTLADVDRTKAAAQPSVARPREAVGMREAIAAAMSRSKREIPHYYLATTIDVTDVVNWVATHNASVSVNERLLLTALLIKAVALACTELQGFSGFYRAGRFEQSERVHVGVAVALRGGGLVAPAVMDTAGKDLTTLMAEFRGLVSRARAGRLRARELAAPTIVLTSLGDGAVDVVFPIIQPPQVAIVGAGGVVDRPWVVADRLEPRKVMTLSLGADHRVTDGRLGAQFLACVASKLADPGSL